MRTAEKIRQSLNEGEFVAHVGDKIEIVNMGGICSDISLRLLNGISNEDIYFSLPNVKDAWKFLKRFNEIGGREVTVELENGNRIPFEESLPYTTRF